MLACQHCRCSDLAVFSNAKAMADFTGGLDTVMYGSNIDKVRRTLITGRITDVMDFTGKASGAKPSLCTLEQAVANISREFAWHYGSTCKLATQLSDLLAQRCLETWYNLAVRTYKTAANSVPLAAASHEADADAALYLQQRLNEAVMEWQVQADLVLNV